MGSGEVRVLTADELEAVEDRRAGESLQAKMFWGKPLRCSQASPLDFSQARRWWPGAGAVSIPVRSSRGLNGPRPLPFLPKIP